MQLTDNKRAIPADDISKIIELQKSVDSMLKDINKL